MHQKKRDKIQNKAPFIKPTDIENLTGENIDESRVELTELVKKPVESNMNKKVSKLVKLNTSDEILERSVNIMSNSIEISKFFDLKQKGNYLKGCLLYFGPTTLKLQFQYERLAKLTGAKCTIQFKPKKITHFLLLDSYKGMTSYDSITKNFDFKVISCVWLVECYRQAIHLNEVDYPNTYDFSPQIYSLLQFNEQKIAKTGSNMFDESNDQSVAKDLLSEDLNAQKSPKGFVCQVITLKEQFFLLSYHTAARMDVLNNCTKTTMLAPNVKANDENSVPENDPRYTEAIEKLTNNFINNVETIIQGYIVKRLKKSDNKRKWNNYVNHIAIKVISKLKKR
ncbi:hypothetical protein K502DRAFT_353683 [Neoconidiobolus thromboides FSU 785]|nr:hypothetical protein K502DRAFT_353683 [Neoconidiobolus thromboides FSU 785]